MCEHTHVVYEYKSERVYAKCIICRKTFTYSRQEKGYSLAHIGSVLLIEKSDLEHLIYGNNSSFSLPI